MDCKEKEGRVPRFLAFIMRERVSAVSSIQVWCICLDDQYVESIKFNSEAQQIKATFGNLGII